MASGSISIAGGTSGAVTLTVPLAAGSGTLTFPSGVTDTIATLTTAGVNSAAQYTWTNSQTFSAKSTLQGNSSSLAAILTNAGETINVSATAATGTINYFVNSQSVLYYTTAATANWTANVSFSSGTTLNSAMADGQVVTISFLATQGGTAYYNNGFKIDNVSITPKWQGGTAPSAGNASGIDAYTYTIIKTGSSAYTVLASVTQFK
jgi:hypothetical protein